MRASRFRFFAGERRGQGKSEKSFFNKELDKEKSRAEARLFVFFQLAKEITPR